VHSLLNGPHALESLVKFACHLFCELGLVLIISSHFELQAGDGFVQVLGSNLDTIGGRN
jgi:hypothetical protein